MGKMLDAETRRQPPHLKSALSKDRLLLTAKLILLTVIVYFIYHQFSAHWQEIKEYDWSIDPWYGLASIGVGLITFMVMASVWRMIIRAFGYKLSFRSAFRIFYLSDLGRYIPGKVWAFFGVLYLARQKGVPPEQAGASFVMVQMFAIPASLLVFVLAAQIDSRLLIDQVDFLGEGTSIMLTGLMIMFSLVVVFWPKYLFVIVNMLLRRLHRPRVDFRLDKKVALAIFLGYCIGWICYGTAFWLFVMAVAPFSKLSLPAGVGLFNAAYQIGYLTLIAPGGLGPREFVMGAMLIPFVGPIGPAVAVAARLWAIILESIAAMLALLTGK